MHRGKLEGSAKQVGGVGGRIANLLISKHPLSLLSQSSPPSEQILEQSNSYDFGPQCKFCITETLSKFNEHRSLRAPLTPCKQLILCLCRSLACLDDTTSLMCSAIPVSFRGWCRLRGPGEWYGLFSREPVLMQWSTDGVDASAAQRTDLYITSSSSTQPATAGTALAQDKPRLPRAALLILFVRGLASNWPPAVAANAHQCCQVAAYSCLSLRVISVWWFYLSYAIVDEFCMFFKVWEGEKLLVWDSWRTEGWSFSQLFLTKMCAFIALEKWKWVRTTAL